MSNAPNLSALLTEVGTLLADGRFSVHIADRYEFEEAAAQQAVMAESFLGKLVAP